MSPLYSENKPEENCDLMEKQTPWSWKEVWSPPRMFCKQCGSDSTVDSGEAPTRDCAPPSLHHERTCCLPQGFNSQSASRVTPNLPHMPLLFVSQDDGSSLIGMEPKRSKPRNIHCPRHLHHPPGADGHHWGWFWGSTSCRVHGAWSAGSVLGSFVKRQQHMLLLRVSRWQTGRRHWRVWGCHE